ncbi:MAG: hypothetical protein E7314_05410 [Clostridiales bacterium]|nr:hypothetical protein [Clostridiales bacterium]
MKKVVWMLTVIFMLLNCSYAKTFSDVGSSHWARGIINEWTNNGIMSGYTDGTFRPSGEVTKAELVTILNKINNDEEIITKRPSKDINLSDWYCVDMGVALKNGLVELDSNGNLNPKSIVTREDAITMIAKLFNLRYTTNPLNVLAKFSDASKIEDKNLPYVAAMVREGYVSGNNGKLNPDKNITRAELVSLLDSTIEAIYTTGKISDKEINGNLVINGEKVALSSVEVHGYIFVLKGAKNGQLEFNNVYASNGIKSDYNNVVSYNDGTKPHDNLSNKEEEKHADEVQFVNIVYSETEWTNKNVTATLKFDDETMEIINNSGKNKYKFKENGEFTFVCVDSHGFEHRYTAKVDNIAKKDLKMSVEVKDNINSADVTVTVLKNEAPIKYMKWINGSKTVDETLKNGVDIANNQFTITETDIYTVVIEDEAGNTARQEFDWENKSKYEIKVIQNVGAKITPEEVKDIPYRGVKTFKIVADKDAGYNLIGIKVDGKLVDNITIIDEKQVTYTFMDVTENHSIEAVVKLREYDFNIIQPENGEITPELALVEHGSNIKFDINPKVGYEVSKVLLDNKEVDFKKVGDGTQYEVKDVTGPHTITAEFIKKKYTITVQIPDTGKITYDNNGKNEVKADGQNKTTAEIKIEHGESLTLYIFPDDGFEVIDVVIDNFSVGARNVYTFREVDASHSFVAMFENGGALETNNIGPYAYAAVYPDYSCVIYGFGETYDFEVDAQPLGEYTSLIQNVVIRSGINNIGAGLFAGCTSLETIELPETVTNIGANAFRNCEKLENIELPTEMEIIGEGTFYNCKALTRVFVSANVRVIANDAFNGCDKLETLAILGDLQEIGDRAFKNCVSLIQLEIPKTVTKIGEEVFFGCKEMQAVEIPKSVQFIGKAAFNDCSKLKVINFKNRTDITSLGREWFPNGGEYREYVNKDTYVVQRESFEIVVIAPVNGKITPGTLYVKRSSTQKFIIEPDVGYKLKELIVDGELQIPTLAYEFKPVLSTHIITATFEPIVYDITYDLAGGVLAVENPSKYTVEEIVSLNNPTRHGYEFIGWEGTELESPTLEVRLERETENRQYTAKWIPANYNIIYANVEGAMNQNPSTYNIESEIALVNPTKLGYTFDGWTENDVTIDLIPAGSTGDKTLTANWTVIPYTITYKNLVDSVFANGDMPVTSYNVESSSITLVTPIRSGFVFKGWTGTDLPDKTFNVVIPQGSTGNREYTANWEEAEYSITYNYNCGNDEIILAFPNPTSYKYTERVVLNNPQRANYTFLGWEDTSTGITSLNMEIPMFSTGTKSFKAIWTAIN